MAFHDVGSPMFSPQGSGDYENALAKSLLRQPGRRQTPDEAEAAWLKMGVRPGKAVQGVLGQRAFGMPAAGPALAPGAFQPTQAAQQAAGWQNPALEAPVSSNAGFNPYGGPGLGQDVFSQGLATLGKLPSYRDFEARSYVNMPPAYTYEDQMVQAPLLSAMRQNAAENSARALGQYMQGSQQMGQQQISAGDLALRAQGLLGDLALKNAAQQLDAQKFNWAKGPQGILAGVATAQGPEAMERLAGILRRNPAFSSSLNQQQPSGGTGDLLTGGGGTMPAAAGIPGQPGIRDVLDESLYTGGRPDESGSVPLRSITDFITVAAGKDPAIFTNPEKFNALVDMVNERYGSDAAAAWLQRPLPGVHTISTPEQDVRQKVLDAYKRLDKPKPVGRNFRSGLADIGSWLLGGGPLYRKPS